MGRIASVVVIPSTFCNLRCSYCYELPLLADKARVAASDLASMFRHLATHFRDNDVSVARIVWHGGEPLLLPPDYFWNAFELQKRAFAEAGATTDVQHTTQTNLTVLDEARIDLLRNGFTGGVGVSLDLFGSLRLNAGGISKEDVAKRNVDLLLARGLPLNGITVLTKANRLRMKGIYDYYRERDMNFRLLPLTKGDYGSGHWFEIEAKDTLRAFCELADLWLYDNTAIQVYPVVTAIRQVLANLVDGATVEAFDRSAFEPLLVVDRDGSVYAYSDFPSDLPYGNVFREPMTTVLASENRKKVVAASAARLEATCRACPHLGQRCNGVPIVEYTTDFFDHEADGRVRCTYRGLVEHVQRRFEEGGIRAAATMQGTTEAAQ